MSHQYCSNGIIEVEVAVLLDAGIEAACEIFADRGWDDAKWAALSMERGSAQSLQTGNGHSQLEQSTNSPAE